MRLKNLNATVHTLIRRPRYLRAIPSLVVLTTAMAWGVAPDDADASDPVHSKARVTLSQTVDAGTSPVAGRLPAPAKPDDATRVFRQPLDK